MGDPAVKIAEFTRDNAVDLVMMPTHGHGLFRRLLLGSVTSKVLHDVHCPVWTAAHAEKQHAQEMPRKILCALDGTREEPGAGAMGRGLQPPGGREPAVVARGADRSAIGCRWKASRRCRRSCGAEARNRIESSLKSRRLDLPLRVAVGEIVATVTEEARQEGADLIVLGRGAIHETLGRLRTHAHGIIQRSPCPVLSV